MSIPIPAECLPIRDSASGIQMNVMESTNPPPTPPTPTSTARGVPISVPTGVAAPSSPQAVVHAAPVGPTPPTAPSAPFYPPYPHSNPSNPEYVYPLQPQYQPSQFYLPYAPPVPSLSSPIDPNYMQLAMMLEQFRNTVNGKMNPQKWAVLLNSGMYQMGHNYGGLSNTAGPSHNYGVLLNVAGLSNFGGPSLNIAGQSSSNVAGPSNFGGSLSN